MKTITLCGSARFESAYRLCATLLAAAGINVRTHGFVPLSDQDVPLIDSQARRQVYDLAMLDKIFDADAVLVVDCAVGDVPPDAGFGYVGQETARELLWTSLQGIPVAFLTDLLAGHTGLEEAMDELAGYIGGVDLQVMELSVAKQLYDVATGRQVVAESQTDTSRCLMHAVLSAIASNMEVGGDPDNPTIADAALRFLDLEPMDEPQARGFLELLFGPVTRSTDAG